MLDTIVLLTGPVEQRVLGAMLQDHNRSPTIRLAATLADLAAPGPDVLTRAPGRVLHRVTAPGPGDPRPVRRGRAGP